jgi:IS605 OrfB family transposase
VLIRKAYKFRLKTNEVLQAQLIQLEGANRFIWNKVLDINLRRLEHPEKKHRRLLTYNDMSGLLTLWKKSEDYSFLRDAPSQTLQQTLKNLHRAFQDGFNKRQPLKRMPVFKSKKHSLGVKFPQGFKLETKRLFLPKVGWVHYFNSRKVNGLVKSMSLSRRFDKWFISIQVELEQDKPLNKPMDEVGIDLGVAKTITLSNGTVLQGSKSYKRYQVKLAKAQKNLSKKVKYSSNWKKQKKTIQLIHEKIKNQRIDRLHWMSNWISRRFEIIHIENLTIKDLTKSQKGTVAQPGIHVQQKKNLNKNILDQGWYEFSRQLEYKQEWTGGWITKVNPAYTSQKCSKVSCGHIDKKNRESQSVFHCQKCGHCENADVNAAKNICAAGHAVFACGEKALAISVKQEPLAA